MSQILPPLWHQKYNCIYFFYNSNKFTTDPGLLFLLNYVSVIIASSCLAKDRDLVGTSNENQKDNKSILLDCKWLLLKCGQAVTEQWKVAIFALID